MGFKERLIVELEHRQVDTRGNGHHGGVDFVTGLVGLNLDLAGIGDHVRVGQNAFAFNHHASAGGFGWRLFGPGFVGVWCARGGKYLDHSMGHTAGTIEWHGLGGTGNRCFGWNSRLRNCRNSEGRTTDQDGPKAATNAR